MKLPPHPSTLKAAPSAHAPVHVPMHALAQAPRGLGGVTARGRSGQILRRTRFSAHAQNQFDLPTSMMEPGWTYQWVRESCYGELDYKNVQTHQMNGWEPVPSTRIPGYFHTADYKGAIKRDGLILMERPKVLDDEALNEQIKVAKDERRNQQADFAGVDKIVPDSMPDGYFTADNDGQRLPFHVGVKSTVEGAPTALYPKRELAIGSDD